MNTEYIRLEFLKSTREILVGCNGNTRSDRCMKIIAIFHFIKFPIFNGTFDTYFHACLVFTSEFLYRLE